MSVPGWLSDVEADELRALARGKVVLELGAWLGRSTQALASSARQVVSVDGHLGDAHTGAADTLDGFLTNVRSFPNVAAVVGRFEDVVPLLAPVFDLVFVDGQHDFASVTRDVALAACVCCGTLALHDWDRFDVTAAATGAGLRPDRVIDSLAVCQVSGPAARPAALPAHGMAPGKAAA